MSDWAPPCVKCGHPSSYHGVTWCVHPSGAAVKRDCDCPGYAHPDLAAAIVEFEECDDRLDGLDGRPLYCARRFGHRGPHSIDREPVPLSMTWRHAERSSSPVGGTQ